MAPVVVADASVLIALGQIGRWMTPEFGLLNLLGFKLAFVATNPQRTKRERLQAMRTVELEDQLAVLLEQPQQPWEKAAAPRRAVE